MAFLLFALCLTVLYSEATWIRIAKCTSSNSIITYSNDYALSIIQSLSLQSSKLLITYNSTHNITSKPNTYPIQQLKNGKIPSYPIYNFSSQPQGYNSSISYGFATKELISETWEGETELLEHLWSTCDYDNDNKKEGVVDKKQKFLNNTFMEWGFLTCGNKKGLKIGKNYCTWGNSNVTNDTLLNQTIEMFIELPDLHFSNEHSKKQQLFADVNACINHPCGAASCVDYPNPAGDNLAGRWCTCGSMSGWDNSSGVCVDFDACVNTCPNTGQTCYDFPPPAGKGVGGRACCNAGYEANLDVSCCACQNIDACSYTPCAVVGAVCTDLPPPAPKGVAGRLCCNPGQTPDTVNAVCVDINACTSFPCMANAVCADLPSPALNNAAGRTCACTAGYRMVNGTTCSNINACLGFPCMDNANCTDLLPPALNNTSGRTCACNLGYTLNGSICQDIDACIHYPCNGTNTSGICIDLPGPAIDNESGRACCLQGTAPIGDNITCEEINACINNPCMPGASCVDLIAPALDDVSGRTCTCNDGYIPNGSVCEDIDACESFGCEGNMTCVDSPPPALNDTNGRTCQCPTGYEVNGVNCLDINACVNNPCGPDATCTDLPPPALNSVIDRSCVCNDGYELINGSCQDINACVHSPCGTGYDCTDYPPPALGTTDGRSCTVPSTTAPPTTGTPTITPPPTPAPTPTPTTTSSSSSTPSPTSTTADINACDNFPCPGNTTCTDLPPPALNNEDGRTCDCPMGYTLQSGSMCQEINACLFFGCGVNAKCTDLPPPAQNNSVGRQCVCIGLYRPDALSQCTVCNATKNSSLTNTSCCNGVHDDNETGKDCGGSFCAPCELGVTCLANADCQSGNICNQNKVCATVAGTNEPTPAPGRTGGLKQSDIIIIVCVIVGVCVICFCCWLFYPRQKDEGQPAVKKRAVRVKSPLRDSTILGSAPIRGSVEMNSTIGTDEMDRIPRPSGSPPEGIKLLTPSQSDIQSPSKNEAKTREISEEELTRLREFLAENQMMTSQEADGIPVDVLTDVAAEGNSLEETFAVCRELYAQGVRLEKIRPAYEASNPKRVKTTYTRTYRIVRQRSAAPEETRQPSSSAAKRTIKKPPPLSPSSPSVASPSLDSMDDNTSFSLTTE